jgi:hypothetical protein
MPALHKATDGGASVGAPADGDGVASDMRQRLWHEHQPQRAAAWRWRRRQSREGWHGVGRRTIDGTCIDNCASYTPRLKKNYSFQFFGAEKYTHADTRSLEILRAESALSGTEGADIYREIHTLFGAAGAETLKNIEITTGAGGADTRQKRYVPKFSAPNRKKILYLFLYILPCANYWRRKQALGLRTQLVVG